MDSEGAESSNSEVGSPDLSEDEDSSFVSSEGEMIQIQLEEKLGSSSSCDNDLKSSISQRNPSRCLKNVRMDDFHNAELKLTCINIRNDIYKGRKRLKGTYDKTIKIRNKIKTLTNFIQLLRQHCYDLPIEDQKLQELCSMKESDYDTSSEEDEGDETENLQAFNEQTSNITDPNYQEGVLNRCNSTVANFVQVTLLGG